MGATTTLKIICGDCRFAVTTNYYYEVGIQYWHKQWRKVKMAATMSRKSHIKSTFSLKWLIIQIFHFSVMRKICRSILWLAFVLVFPVSRSAGGTHLWVWLNLWMSLVPSANRIWMLVSGWEGSRVTEVLAAASWALWFCEEVAAGDVTSGVALEMKQRVTLGLLNSDWLAEISLFSTKADYFMVCDHHSYWRSLQIR